MRQAHVGGDKLFVDYADDTVPVIIDRLTGQVRAAQIFVAVLGATNFTYTEASWTQSLADWIGGHTRAFAALGGAPKLRVPDNTKVAVIKACLYEPQVNRTYAEMAAHAGELLGQPGDDGLPLIALAFCFGLIAAQDVARRADLDFFDEELGLAPRAIDEQRCQGLRVLEHKAADDGTAALAGAEDIFQPALLQRRNGGSRDHAAVGDNAQGRRQTARATD